MHKPLELLVAMIALHDKLIMQHSNLEGQQVPHTTHPILIHTAGPWLQWAPVQQGNQHSKHTQP